MFNWLHSALKFSDWIALHYLQEICGINPEPQGSAGEEMSLYKQLKGISGQISTVGRNLGHLYNLENSYKHRYRKRVSGKGNTNIVSPSKYDALNDVKEKFPTVLRLMLDIYKKTSKP